MGVNLTYERVEKLLDGYAPTDARAYCLSLDYGESFGFLYVDASRYTIAWPGTVNFFRLESDLVGSLLEILSYGKLSRISSSARRGTVAHFVKSNHEDVLLHFPLGNPELYTAYEQTLKDYYALSFARYDIRLEDYNIDFAVTADSPSTDRGEIAFQAPRYVTPNFGLINWVFAHHRLHERKVPWQPDIEDTRSVLNGLISGKL